MKKVYRLEHKSIQDDRNKVFAGPYSFSTSLDIEVEDWADESTEGHSDKNHPEPLLDKQLFKKLQQFNKEKHRSWTKSLFFGFKSLNQLQKWFSKKELQRLKDEGFCIAVYETKERYDSKYQAAFIPNKKTRVIIDM